MAELLRGVLEAIDIGVVVIDASRHLAFVNRAARALLGADADAALAVAAAPGDPVAQLHAALGGHGLRCSIRPLPGGGACAVLDAAVTTEGFLDSIVENIPNMIFVKDAEQLRFERVNRAGEHLLGQPRSALLGKNDFDFFGADQAEFFQAKDRETLAGGVVVDIPEEPIDTPAGQRWLHTKKIPLLDAEGRPRYLLGISEDITERKLALEALARAHEELERRVVERTAALTQEMAERQRAEEALLASERHLRQSQKLEAVGRLAGGVAHDFNNLLTVVMTQASLLRNHPELTSLRNDALAAIIDAARRASTLTRQLLAFSSRQVLRPRDVDLSEILVGMAPMLKRMLGEQITLTVEPRPDGGWIRADPSQLEQVILNLVVNARDAITDTGRLDVVVSAAEITATTDGTVPPGRYVVLTVTDTGTGMDAHTQAHLFEPFFTTKPAGRGTGLGLSTVYGIVTQSGGCITVRSELGHGARFAVYFPEVAAVRGEGARPTDAPGPVGRGRETVLLVEDDEAVRSGIRAVLVEAGHDVIAASDGYDALRRLEAAPDAVQVLVTDLVMPIMSGRELARRARAIAPELPVLFISGYAPPTDVAFAPHETFLPKPFETQTLLRTLREVCDAAPPRAQDRSAG